MTTCMGVRLDTGMALLDDAVARRGDSRVGTTTARVRRMEGMTRVRRMEGMISVRPDMTPRPNSRADRPAAQNKNGPREAGHFSLRTR